MARGHTWRVRRNYDQSIADYDEAIRIDPRNAGAFLDRGMARRAMKDYGGAIADYEQALRLTPKLAPAHNNIAWLLATCPDASFRDGKRAVEVAKLACELSGWKDPNHLDTLAAAYAEAGDFARAAEWQEKAIGLAKGETSGENWAARLELYRAKTPFRVD